MVSKGLEKLGAMHLAYISAALIAVTGILVYMIQNVVLEPYMDEIFHIPQARQYCDYNWTHWDPMITTLPGLYLSSIALLFPVASALNLNLLDVCTTANLRACNYFFTAGNFFLLYALTIELQGKGRHLVKGVYALVLALFPVAYFFTFMYYTDPGSVFFTLMMYLLCLKEQHFGAALSGVISILFRQPNVFWVIFCIALVKIDIVEKHVVKVNKLKKKLNEMGDFEVFKLTLKTLLTKPMATIGLVWSIISGTISYLMLVVGFAVFVYLNEGFAVGDKSNHTVSYNFPQVFYFLLISAAFSFVHLIWPRQILAFIVAVLKNPIKTIMFVASAYFIIKTFTYEHIYTLSDNRHYTFYFWSKLFKRHELARYAMIPVYLYSLYQFFVLTVHKGFLWRVTFVICTVASLFPLPLLEFRYFILHFYILRLNMKLPAFKYVIAELLFYFFVNIFTIYMFVYKPFTWPSEPELQQRFMW